MHKKQIFRQMLEFNKAIFDSNVKTMFLFQNQSEQYILRFLDKSDLVSEEGKKAISEWLNDYKKSYEKFKGCADENYQKAIDYFVDPQTHEERNDKVKS